VNILNINSEDTCGISKMLCDYINEKTKHDAHCVIRYLNSREYPFEYLWDANLDEDKLRELCEWADILHFNIWPPSCGMGHVDFREYVAKGKKVVMQFHGTVFRRTPLIRKEVEDNGYKTLVTMPIMMGYMDDEKCRTEWLPFPIPTDDPRFMPIPEEDKFPYFAVAHAPGEVHRWEIKDTDMVQDIFQRCGRVAYNPDVSRLDTDYLAKTVEVVNSKDKKNMRLVLMTDTPWEKCLWLKQRCHVSFDHLQGYYGVNTAESCSMGIPSICQLNKQYHDAAEERYGRELPFVVSDRVILEDTINMLKDDEELRMEIGIASRDYAVKVHDLESSVVPQLLKVYKEVYDGDD
jgi:hypothetical protein